MNEGRFDTTTKTKLTTKYGNILKVINYESEGQEQIDYKIRPTCSICGGDVSCVCYNDDNSNEPFDAAINGLQQQWCCEKPHCICEFTKTIWTEKYEELVAKYGNDEHTICEVLREEMSEDDDGIFCEI